MDGCGHRMRSHALRRGIAGSFILTLGDPEGIEAAHRAGQQHQRGAPLGCASRSPRARPASCAICRPISHIRHLSTKLDTHRRGEAVKRARAQASRPWSAAAAPRPTLYRLAGSPRSPPAGMANGCWRCRPRAAAARSSTVTIDVHPDHPGDATCGRCGSPGSTGRRTHAVGRSRRGRPTLGTPTWSAPSTCSAEGSGMGRGGTDAPATAGADARPRAAGWEDAISGPPPGGPDCGCMVGAPPGAPGLGQAGRTVAAVP
jgi:hypothetical protein